MPTASERLIHSTARISCFDAYGRESSGTGFWFKFNVTPSGSFIPALVTNRHVIEGATKCIFHVTPNDRQTGRPLYGSHFAVELSNGEADCIIHPDPNVDLAIIPVGAQVNEWLSKELSPMISFFGVEDIIDDNLIGLLPPMVDVVMTGYPIGIWDSINNMPILRKGSSATPYELNYEGRPEFVIDAACFPGSSGSPICLVIESGFLTVKGGIGIGGPHFKLIGVLYAGPQFTAQGDLVVEDIPTSNKPISLTRIPSNLGFCIKADQILQFESMLSGGAN